MSLPFTFTYGGWCCLWDETGAGCNLRVQQMVCPGVFFTQMNMIFLQWYDMKETKNC